ncbi:MAG TPA: M4 family metallopeptidase [Thermoanaerobaculia bacterium]|nr:M4 family metallopeptidase [Thermoanaerobaculia bacterium]
MCDQPFRHVHCNIIPPHILRKIAENGTAKQKDLAFRALNISAHFRGQRQVLNAVAMLAATPTGQKRRNVYDAQQDTTLPGNLVRSEGQAPTGDVAADEAYDSAGLTYDFYQAVFERNSLDGRGLRLDSSVHYSNGYNNAFWNGQQMIYGDGDGTIFTRFTVSVDVIAHELTHGITQHEANLVYQGQSGALNEHLSDVFGSLVKQYVKGQAADAADWLIGQGLLLPSIRGVAIRSLKAPGTAYDDPTLGRDPQPDHMDNYVDTEDDNGGVHINSGIPNKAFFNLAMSLGGKAWDQAGHIWYTTLIHELGPNDVFQDCANKTYKVAGQLYGAAVADQVRAAWQTVGLGIVTAAAPAPAAPTAPAAVAAQAAPAAAPAATLAPAAAPKAQPPRTPAAPAAGPKPPAGKPTGAARSKPRSKRPRPSSAKTRPSSAKSSRSRPPAAKPGAGARSRPARPARPAAARSKPAATQTSRPRRPRSMSSGLRPAAASRRPPGRPKPPGRPGRPGNPGK